MTKKSVTIEKLARMVERGFKQTATKSDIGRLEKRLDDVDHRLLNIELKLDNVAYRFELEALAVNVTEDTGFVARYFSYWVKYPVASNSVAFGSLRMTSGLPTHVV